MMVKQALIETIEHRYDPNHDMPEGVQVTWVDAYLLEIIKAQQEQIEKLQRRVDSLSGIVDRVRVGEEMFD